MSVDDWFADGELEEMRQGLEKDRIMTEQEWWTSDNPVGMLKFAHQVDGKWKGRYIISDRKLNRILEAWKSDLCGEERWCLGGLGGEYLIDKCFDELRNITNKFKSMAAHLIREILGNPFQPLVCDPVWQTPVVLSLAQAAYEGRAGSECRRCGGCGRLEKNGSDHPCPDCRNGRVEDGSLDPLTLCVLADALEEAGCPAEVCERDPSHRRTRSEHTICAECDAWIVPHPLLAHLRSPGPHVRGCWATDILLRFS